MREALQNVADGLQRLAESGNVRTDGESLLSGLRVSVGQLLEADATSTQAAAAAQPDPVDVRLAYLAESVTGLSEKFSGVVDLVDQLAKLAGDLQAATVKGA
ncbi:hypothetical protein [Aquabacterium sp.]|uniref:hypothetical protein n=1 Tax=Aquabacterium sp. TaxID=1872578 RepID=UPI0025C18274|nr:hypothetical protein [Aquabacterium sp.]